MIRTYRLLGGEEIFGSLFQFLAVLIGWETLHVWAITIGLGAFVQSFPITMVVIFILAFVPAALLRRGFGLVGTFFVEGIFVAGAIAAGFELASKHLLVLPPEWRTVTAVLAAAAVVIYSLVEYTGDGFIRRRPVIEE